MTQRAAIYARYSSDLQSDRSIDDQIRLCKDLAHRNGLEVITTYTDHAISGGTMIQRPELLTLLEDARAGSFDIVLAEALDRLSRDQEDVAAIYKRLAYADVPILTEAEGTINELHIGLKGTMNALFLKDLALKTRRGQRGAVEQGKIPGGKSYGYKIVRKINDNGNVTTGERAIDPTEGAIVDRIFNSYVRGMTPRQIAAELNHEGIPSPRGGQWNASTINGSRSRRNGILNNELYRGIITYNRQRFVKDPITGKRTARPNPESKWIRKPVPHLRVISDDLWDAALQLRARYSSREGNKRQTKKRILTGLLRCGACGGAMTTVNRDRYYCANKREKGTCTSAVSVKAPAAEARVIKALQHLLFGQEHLIDAFITAFNEEISRLNKHDHGPSSELANELAKVNKAIDRCMIYITQGDGDPSLVSTELTKLTQQKTALTAKLNPPTKLQPILSHPNATDLFARKVAALADLIEDPASQHQAFEQIRSLIDKIEVHPGDDKHRPELILHGKLAEALHLALLSETTQQKTAQGLALSGFSDRRVLLVAGARLAVSASPHVSYAKNCCKTMLWHVLRSVKYGIHSI